MERTLVILKPDAIQRSLVGEIISRFERAGLKICACKLTQIDETFAKKHYFDVAERRGQHVLDMLLGYMTSAPVLAMCVEGIEAVENVRKLVGGTEPKSANPGTIRGDFAHSSFEFCDDNGQPIQNLVHASGNKEEAKFELGLWFTDQELMNYNTGNAAFTLGAKAA